MFLNVHTVLTLKCYGCSSTRQEDCGEDFNEETSNVRVCPEKVCAKVGERNK